MEKGVNLFVSAMPPGNLDELLSRLFWKDPSLAKDAKDFIEYLKEWSRSGSPYQASDWEKYCLRERITQSRYHNMLRRLRKAGLVEKKYNKSKRAHEIRLSDDFSNSLMAAARIWEEYLTS